VLEDVDGLLHVGCLLHALSLVQVLGGAVQVGAEFLSLALSRRGPLERERGKEGSQSRDDVRRVIKDFRRSADS
jgi:hypothetical protein